MNYGTSTQARLADINLGMRVDRAAAALTSDQLFTITGGRIALLGFVGEVVADLDGTASTIQITSNPTVGNDTVFCIASGSMASKTAGTKVTLPAAASSGATISTNEGAAILSAQPVWVVSAGTIDIVVGTGDNPGTMKWSLFYVPIDDGAYVTAA